MVSISTPFSCIDVVALIVGAINVPVKVGLAMLAFKFSAVYVAVDFGLLASLVLSTLLNPTMLLVIPLIVPEQNSICYGCISGLPTHSVNNSEELLIYH